MYGCCHIYHSTCGSSCVFYSVVYVQICVHFPVVFCAKILHVMSMILKTILSASAVHVLAVKEMNVQENDCRWQCKGLMLWQSKAQHPP